MNVIELLKDDHEKVSRLFKSYEAARKSRSESGKEAIVAQICEELSVHAQAEEELFYPSVEEAGEKDEKAQGIVDEGYEEHTLIETLITELRQMSASDEHYDAKVKVLKDLKEHHVEEEEGRMMPKAEELLSSEELEAIGTEVESRKEELKAQYAEGHGKAGGAASGRQKLSAPSSAKSKTSRKKQPA